MSEDHNSDDREPGLDISATDINDMGSGDDDSDESDSQRDPDTTRSKKQIPVYLPPEMRADVEELYEELDSWAGLRDGRSIEKHKDFFETVFEFVLENDDEIADRLDIERGEL